MANLGPHRNALILRITREGNAHSSAHDRKAAFEGRGPDAARSLLEKVRLHAYKITDEDIDAAKRAGLGEDQIFELVVSAAAGQANRQLESALAALAEATKG